MKRRVKAENFCVFAHFLQFLACLVNGIFRFIEATSSSSQQKAELRKRQACFSLDLKDIRSFKLVECGNPPETCVRFHAKDGTSYTPLRFRSGNSTTFVTELQKFVTLKR